MNKLNIFEMMQFQIYDFLETIYWKNCLPSFHSSLQMMHQKIWKKKHEVVSTLYQFTVSSFFYFATKIAMLLTLEDSLVI